MIRKILMIIGLCLVSIAALAQDEALFTPKISYPHKIERTFSPLATFSMGEVASTQKVGVKTSIPQSQSYLEEDVAASGTSASSDISGIVTIERFGTDSALVLNFWGLKDTLRAKINESAGTISINPGKIYQHSTYGEIWACMVDVSSKKYSKTAPITGTYNADGSITLGSWGAIAVEKGTSFGIFAKTNLRMPNATVTENIYRGEGVADSVSTYPAYINQTYDNQISIINFGNDGQTVSAYLHADKSVEIPNQYIGASGSYEFLCYPAEITTDGVKRLKKNIEATGTNTTITLGNWGAFTTSNTYLRVMRSTTITFLDGTISYPEALVQDWTGDGSETKPYVITKPLQMLAFADDVNSGNDYQGKYVMLGNDISMAETTSAYRPVGVYVEKPFRGHFDGANHRIVGLSINQTEPYVGVFGYCDTTSVIQNLTVDSITIVSIGQYVGAVAGYSWGIIKDVTVTNAVINHYSTYGGGVVGEFDGQEMRNVSFSGNFNGYGRMGGVVGVLRGNAYNLEAHGSLKLVGMVDFAVRGLGGLVGTTSPRGKERALLSGGYNDATLTDASGYGNVGGIVGEAFTGTIQQCFNAGPISSQTKNYNSTSTPDGAVGGVCGTSWGGTVQDCYNGNLVMNTYASNKIGGIMGYARNPMQTISQDKVTYSYFTTVKNCYNSGQVMLPTMTATQGVYGTSYSDSVFTNCYYDQQITGSTMPDSAARMQKTTLELISAPLEGLNADVWDYTEGLYPKLKACANVSAATLMSAPLTLSNCETAKKVKSNFLAGTNGGVFWNIYTDGQFVTSDSVLSISGDSVLLQGKSGSELMVARVEGSNAFRMLYLEMLSTAGFKGSGTVADPFQISDKGDLIALNNAVMNNAQSFDGEYFVQTNDIDLNYATDFSGIGTDNRTTHVFGGTYDGQGYSIHRLKIDGIVYNADGSVNKTGGRTNAGFFGFIKACGTVKNLNIAADCDIQAYSYVGAIAGHNYGKIENCRNYAPVTVATQYAGGIAGYNDNAATITDCYNAGTITAGYQCAAGIASYNTGTISYCQNDGEVLCDSVTSLYGKGKQTSAAGISNINYTNALVEGCVNSGHIKAPSSAGGLFTSLYSATIQIRNNLNYGVVEYDSPETSTRGGVSAQMPSTQLIENNIYDAQLAPYGGAACATYEGIVARSTSELVSGKAIEGYDAEKFSFVAGQYPVLKAFKDEPAAWAHRQMVVNFGDGSCDDVRQSAILAKADTLTWNLAQNTSFKIGGATLTTSLDGATNSVRDTIVATIGSYTKSIPLRAMPILFEGEGTATNPFQIRSKDDMLLLARLTNEEDFPFNGYHFKMLNDIDFDTTAYVPVGMDSHKFNADFNGDNHKFTNINYNSTAISFELRGLFGTIAPEGVVHNVILQSGTINNSRFGGGIAGKVYGRIDSCINRAKVTTSKYLGVGGIAAQVMSGGSITNCRNEGEVAAAGLYTAGIVYLVQEDAIVENCVNASSKLGDGTHGGVAGIVTYSYGRVANCENTGDITAVNNVAGIVQQISPGSVIENCVNRGKITSTGSYVGGIVSLSNTAATVPMKMINCHNYGAIQGNSFTGGLAGRLYYNISMTNCSNESTVTAYNSPNYVGGLVGYMSGSTTYETYLDSCHNAGAVSGGKGMVGGLIGSVNNNVNLRHCYNSGNVTASGNQVGGLFGVGYGTYENCYNIADVTSAGYEVGGIGGFGNATLKNCFNLGTVTAKGTCTAKLANAGGLWGYGAVNINDCYNMGTVTGNGYVGGIAGLLTSGAQVHRCYAAASVLTTDNATSGNVAIPLLSGASVTLDSVYYDKEINADLASTTDEKATACSLREITSCSLGDSFVEADGMYPTLANFQGYPLSNWFAAVPVLAEGDVAKAVTKPFVIGTPDSTIWTSSENLSISGNKVSGIALGDAWLTKTYGKYSKTYRFTITALSSILDITKDATIESETYYDLAGHQVSKINSGILLKVTRYQNGTTKCEKVVF